MGNGQTTQITWHERNSNSNNQIKNEKWQITKLSHRILKFDKTYLGQSSVWCGVVMAMMSTASRYQTTYVDIIASTGGVPSVFASAHSIMLYFFLVPNIEDQPKQNRYNRIDWDVIEKYFAHFFPMFFLRLKLLVCVIRVRLCVFLYLEGFGIPHSLHSSVMFLSHLQCLQWRWCHTMYTQFAHSVEFVMRIKCWGTHSYSRSIIPLHLHVNRK